MATLTTTPIKVFVSGETVTPAKLNELSQSTVALTAGTIVDADVSASAAIAASKLSTAAQQALLPAGAVMPFAMNSAPSGWLAADGAAVNRVGTYAALFAAIGTTHGAGDGSTTFNLPDLRGIFVRGSGSQTIDGTAYSGTHAGKQKDALKDHAHTYTLAVNSNVYSHNGGAGALRTLNAAAVTSGPNSPNDSGTETRPANISLLYCIKF